MMFRVKRFSKDEETKRQKNQRKGIPGALAVGSAVGISPLAYKKFLDFRSPSLYKNKKAVDLSLKLDKDFRKKVIDYQTKSCLASCELADLLRKNKINLDDYHKASKVLEDHEKSTMINAKRYREQVVNPRLAKIYNIAEKQEKAKALKSLGKLSLVPVAAAGVGLGLSKIIKNENIKRNRRLSERRLKNHTTD